MRWEGGPLFKTNKILMTIYSGTSSPGLNQSPEAGDHWRSLNYGHSWSHWGLPASSKIGGANSAAQPKARLAWLGD